MLPQQLLYITFSARCSFAIDHLPVYACVLGSLVHLVEGGGR